MSMRVIMAFSAAIILSICAVVGMRWVGGMGPDQYRGGDSAVELASRAPDVFVDPMEDVGSSEAGRRSSLHAAAAAEVMEASARMGDAPGFVAAPVIEETFEGGGDNDPFKEEMFRAETDPEPAPVVEVAAVEQEPAVEPELEPAAEPEPAPVRIVANPRALDLVRQGYRQGRAGNGMVMDGIEESLDGIETPGGTTTILRYETPDLDQQSSLDLDALIGPRGAREMRATLSRIEAPDDGWFASYEVAQLEMDAVNSVSDFIDQRFNGPDNTAAFPLRRTADGLQVAKPGDFFFATLDFGFNSDDPGGLPIFGTITDQRGDGTIGPLDGARIQGSVQYSETQAAIQFNRVITERGEIFAASAIAVDGAAARTGVAGRLDRHRVERFGALFLAGLIQGFSRVGTAIVRGETQAQTVVVVPPDDASGDSTLQIEPEVDVDLASSEAIASAFEPVGDALAADAATGFNRPPTISARPGMGFAIVFTEPLVIPFQELRR